MYVAGVWQVCGRCVAGVWLALQMGFSWSLEAGSSTYIGLVHLCKALSVPSATGAQAPSRANRASRESRVKFFTPSSMSMNFLYLPEDFRGIVIFLTSKASDYVNGTSLIVNGGLILNNYIRY